MADMQRAPRSHVLSAMHRMKSGLSAASGSIGDAVENATHQCSRMVERVDKWAASNVIGRTFDLRARHSKFSSEVRAGTITFLMISYILALNPQILGSTGGTCNAEELCSPQAYQRLGTDCMFKEALPQAVHCLETLKMNLITATAASSLIACFLMGYMANLPLALAPGMGINIYVAYQVVGTGDLTYQQAMAAIFVEGWIFLILSITGVRGGITRYMPINISFATSVGIGLLLAFTGLRNMGVVVFNDSTLLTLGGCPEAERSYIFTSDVPGSDVYAQLCTTNASVPLQEASPSVYSCSGDLMRSPTMWLGISGGVLMALLMAAGVKGPLFIGIAFVTMVSWIPGHAASYLGAESSIPGGATRMDVFKRVVAAPSLSQTGLAWDWSAFNSGNLWLALFTFLYIDLLDCTGTLLAMARLLDDEMQEEHVKQGRLEPYKPFMSESKEFAGQMWAFMADGAGIVVGSMMGVTPLTVYIESTAGIEDGGRTGITAIVVSAFFFVSLFFSPILASIPPYATGPALVLVGVLLIGHVDHIAWDDYLESIPAFLTIIMMPFTTSVAYGLLAGLGSWFLLHLPGWIVVGCRTVHIQFMKRFRPDAGSEDSGPRAPPSSTPSRRPRRQVRKAFGDVRRATTTADSDDAVSVSSFRSRMPTADEAWAPEAWGGQRGLPRSHSHGELNGSSPGNTLNRASGSHAVQLGRRSGQPLVHTTGPGPRFSAGPPGLKLSRSRTFNDLESTRTRTSTAEVEAAQVWVRSRHALAVPKLFPEVKTMSSEAEQPKDEFSMFGGGLMDLNLSSSDDEADAKAQPSADGSSGAGDGVMTNEVGSLSLALAAARAGGGDRPPSPDLEGFRKEPQGGPVSFAVSSKDADGADMEPTLSRTVGSISFERLEDAPARAPPADVAAPKPAAGLAEGKKSVSWNERGVGSSYAAPETSAAGSASGGLNPRGLKRVESVAAARLRSLFSDSEEAAASAAAPPQAGEELPRSRSVGDAPLAPPSHSPFDMRSVAPSPPPAAAAAPAAPASSNAASSSASAPVFQRQPAGDDYDYAQSLHSGVMGSVEDLV